MLNIEALIGETNEYEKKQFLEVRKPKSWCKTVSAFANTSLNYGVILFGITDDDQVVGLENAEHDAEIISEQIKERLNPVPTFHLEFHKTEDRKVIIALTVFAGISTPYYYDADGSLTAYHRIGNQSVPVSNTKLKELVMKGVNITYDTLESKYSLSESGFIKLKATYKKRTNNMFNDSDLISFGLVNENGKLTNAGALFMDESPVYNSRVFCTRWNGMTKASGLIDALDDDEYSDNLINLVQESVKFVSHNTKKAWMKTADGRIEMPEYPARAVLEGIVNGLIHRCYMDMGSEVHIDIFDDRLEIYSPGGMFDGSLVQNCDVMNVSSRRRNPVLADLFNRLKYMDRRGSGFKKIVEEYENQYKYVEELRPEFRSDASSFYLILHNLNYSDNKEKNKNATNPHELTRDSKINNEMKMNKMGIDIIKLIEDNPTITRIELSKLLDLTEGGIKYHINKLKALGMLKHKGSKRNGYWEIIDK